MCTLAKLTRFGRVTGCNGQKTPEHKLWPLPNRSEERTMDYFWLPLQRMEIIAQHSMSVWLIHRYPTKADQFQ
jgi:hypothetical protein